MNKIIYILIGTLFLSSCEETEVVIPDGTTGQPVEVIREVRISLQPMGTVGAPATRAQDEQLEEGEAVYVSYGRVETIDKHVTTRVQEDLADNTKDESTINNAYVLQFGGTSSTAVLKKKISVTSDQLRGSNPVTCTFSMTSGVKNRVYVVVNCSKTLTEGTTTLGDFEAAVTFAPSSTVPTSGLPMSACQDLGVGDAFDVFQLRSVLAKLTFTCKTAGATMKLKGLPVGYSFYTQAAGDSPVRPGGMIYNADGVTLTSGSTYYVPENLSGCNDLLINSVTRCCLFAPANSMYVVITANSTTYDIYLGSGGAKDFNVVGNDAYYVTVSLLGSNNAYDLRVGNTIPPGTVVTDLTVSGETANCYLVTVANAWYMFNNTVMGNGAVTPVPADLNANSIASAIIPTRLNPASGDVLWETLNTRTAPSQGDVVNKSIYLLRNRFLFKSGAAEGNAVIAARDASGTIVWSWHIWRTNSVPQSVSLAAIEDDADFSVTGLEMMDRNLGALSAAVSDDLSTGLFYQWGRKDPMPAYAGLSSPNNVAMATQPAGIPTSAGGNNSRTPADAVKNPTTFFTSNSGNQDWAVRNDNLWGTFLTATVTNINGNTNKYNINKGSKSIYDPCPVGWRVPPAYAFANVSTSTSSTFNVGRSFNILISGSSWFPASGYRDGGNVTLNNIGNCGYYWVSSSCVSYLAVGGKFSFDSSVVSPAYYDSRAGGNSVRCVKESFVSNIPPIDLSASGTANCYVVTKSGRYSFDATVMGNGKTTLANGAANSADITPTVLSPASVEVLWESLNTTTAPAKGDVVSDVKLVGNKKVVFSAGTKQGNAVIAVKNASGTIIWSWHIWRTNSVPKSFSLAEIKDGLDFSVTGMEIMDRNLGALSATMGDNLSTGLLYQWGRKDPFPAYAGLTVPNNVAMATLPSEVLVIGVGNNSKTPADAVKNPTTFYTSTNASYDWGTRNDNLWGTPLRSTVSINGNLFNRNSGSKSIYDPCPVGWRVPSGYVFANTVINSTTGNGSWKTNGWSFSIGQNSTSGWLSASGHRYNGNGSLTSFGVGGYWTSALNGGDPPTGNLLYFSSDIVDPANNRSRAVGSSIRCSRDL